MSGKVFDLTPESVPNTLARRPASARRSGAWDAEAVRVERQRVLRREAMGAAMVAEQDGDGGAAPIPSFLHRNVGPEEWAAAVRRATEDRAYARAWLAQRHAEQDAAAGVLQAQAEVGREGGALSPALSGRIGARRGGGQPLEATVRRGMEGVFQVSFGHVRVHADPEADALNRGVAAIAFTVGSDIFFRAGFYQPRTPAGQHLLAHELTHVVQQRTGSLGTSGGNGGGTMTVGAADDRHEQEAEATAYRVTAALQARGQALAAPATSPGAALSRAHDPAVDLAPAASGIARAAAPPSWPAPPTNKTGLVPLAVPRPGAIVAGAGTSLPLAAPFLAAARVIPQPLPVGAPVLLLGHDGASGGSGWSYVRLVAPPWAGREGWLSSAAIKLTPAPAAPRFVLRDPPLAFVFSDIGANLHVSEPQPAAKDAALPPGPRVPSRSKLRILRYQQGSAWAEAQVLTCPPGHAGFVGQRGWVNVGLLDTDWPDPEARMYPITTGDTAEHIVKEAGYRFAPGRDARYYINVLAYVNKPHTLYNPAPHPEQVDHWKKTVAVVNETIWLPGQAFADSLTGVVGSGSITGGAWATLQQELGWARCETRWRIAIPRQQLDQVIAAALHALAMYDGKRERKSDLRIEERFDD